MIQSEFYEWLNYHIAAYPGISTWQRKIEAKEHLEGEPTLEAVMQAWFRSVYRATLEEAKQATDMLGIDEPEPQGFGSHHKVIGRICKKLRGDSGRSGNIYRGPKLVDGEEVVKCLRCQDGGIVSIWSADAMRAARDGKPIMDVLYKHCCVRCTCEAAIGHGYLLPFNEVRHLPFPGPFEHTEGKQAELRDFVKGGFDRKLEAAAWTP